MEALPLLSVVVPVYNVEPYLNTCIRSIAEQTYPNLEILLVDDGSTDRSGEICDQWAEKDNRIRVIHQENGGAGLARNRALDQARGELIGMVDSDDYLHPNFYAHLYSLMGPQVDVAECAICVTEGENAPLDDGSQARVQVCSREEAMKLHIRDQLFCQTPPNKLYRRSVVGDIRFPVGNLIDDEFWTYRVLGNARSLAASSSRMYAYRQQPGSAMHKPFSLRRLQGLDAKVQRLNYLRRELPALEYEARYDLFFTCLFAMQGCQKSLNREDLATAKKKIRGILDEITPLGPNPEATALRNVLLKLAQVSFTGTSRLLNLLIDLHVLT